MNEERFKKITDCFVSRWNISDFCNTFKLASIVKSVEYEIIHKESQQIRDSVSTDFVS